MGAGSTGFASNCLFEDNTASTGSAGVLLVTGAGTTFTLTNGTALRRNTAVLNGGAVSVETGAVYLRGGTTFEDNTALEGEGGAIAFVYSNNTELDNTVLTGNQAGLEGGGVYNIAYTYLFNTFRATDTTFTGNAGSLYYGTTGGGGLFLYRIQLIEITRATFVSNSAQDGGGVYVDGHVRSANVSDSTFEQNTASRNGGAIWFEGTQITSVHGSVIGEDEAAEFALEGSAFSANSTAPSNLWRRSSMRRRPRGRSRTKSLAKYGRRARRMGTPRRGCGSPIQRIKSY